MFSAPASFQPTNVVEPAAHNWIHRLFHGVNLGLVLIASFVAIATAQTIPVDPPDVGEDRWWDGFHAPGLGVRNGWPDHSVAFLDVVHGELVAGGKLRIRSSELIHDAARYDGTTWRVLGDGPGGEIVVGTKHGDDLVCVVNGEPLRLRRWDGATWTTLSEFSVDHAENHISGHNYPVRPYITSIASFGDGIAIGGIFDEIGGVAAENVAAWDGSRWRALGAGLSAAHPFRNSDCVTSLIVFQGSLVAGGGFSESDGAQELQNVAQWNGSRWLPVGGGLEWFVDDLAVQSGTLYATGDFSTGGRLMRWNGRGWKSLMPLLPADFYVSHIASSPRGLAIAGITGGRYGDVILGDLTSKLLLLDGTNWTVLGEKVRNGFVRKFAEFHGSLVAGGRFMSIDDAAANGLAFMDAGEWRVAITGASLDAPQDSYGFLGDARVFLPEGADLIAGGRFLFAGERRAGGIARWTGQAWSPFERGTDGDVEALARWNGLLVAGGRFRHAGEVEASNIATWDGTVWRPLGAGLDGHVMAVVDYDGELIAAGSFIRTGERQIYNVARWDGSQWQPVGFGLWDAVSDLVVYRGELFAGGAIDWDGRMRLGPVARWTGQQWETFGAIFGYVRHLRVVDDELYVVGRVKFSEARNAPVHQVARWDGANWQPVGDRPDLWFGDVAKYGDALVASVSYYTQYPDHGPINGRLYQFRNGNWEPLSRALKSLPTTLVSHGGSLYCGGHFREAGEGRESLGIARWDGGTADITTRAVVAPTWSTSLEPIGFARAGHPVRIAFRAGTTGEARVEVFDVRGRRIRSLARMHVTPGRHVIDWDLSDDHQSSVARGLYFVRLQLDGEHAVRKVVVTSR